MKNKLFKYNYWINGVRGKVLNYKVSYQDLNEFLVNCF